MEPPQVSWSILNRGSCPYLKKRQEQMLPKLLENVSLFRLLHRIDLDFAKQTQQRGCPFCNGRLDFASYTRQPRGGPDELPEEFSIRLSLCCSEESCRRRTLPPSCLFMGRRVYWACAIVVAMALRQKKSGAWCINKIASTLNVL